MFRKIVEIFWLPLLIALLSSVMLAQFLGRVFHAWPAQQKSEKHEQPPSVQTPTVKGLLDGSRAVVFDTAKDSCELIDIPDIMARAFRDYQGTVHLVASHYVLRQ